MSRAVLSRGKRCERRGQDWMALLRYFQLKSRKQPLPDPNGDLSSRIPSSGIASANASVSQLLDNVDGSSSIDSRGPRGPYNVLTPAQKYEIGKKAAEIGTTAAMRYYSKHYPELSLKETSVRRFKTNYQADLKERLKMPEEDSEGTVRELVPKKRGRPLLIGEELDGQVREYVKELRKLGVVINAHVVIAVGMGLVINKNANLLVENGGHISLEKHWAKYLLARMGFVKRRGNTKSKVSVEQFDELKELFLLEFNNAVEMDEVPQQLVINWDQTGINYVPVSSWTMEQEGSKRVELLGKDDKRQLTALFACSMSGDFLPIQLVYQGKTIKCLPKFKFPVDWDVTYTSNHWCNELTMHQYISKIILPYIHNKREELKLPPDQPAVLIFDNFKGQCTSELLTLLDTNNISVILVPPNCTDRLQPLDLSVNKAAKEFLRRRFHEWYAKQVCSHLQGKTTEPPKDLRLSTVKPLGAQWMVDMYDYIKGKAEIIRNGFKEAGLLKL